MERKTRSGKTPAVPVAAPTAKVRIVESSRKFEVFTSNEKKISEKRPEEKIGNRRA